MIHKSAQLPIILLLILGCGGQGKNVDAEGKFFGYWKEVDGDKLAVFFFRKDGTGGIYRTKSFYDPKISISPISMKWECRQDGYLWIELANDEGDFGGKSKYEYVNDTETIRFTNGLMGIRTLEKFDPEFKR
jgi:hypothetical protein